MGINMNIKVAICDDEQSFIDKIIKYSNMYAKNQKVYIEINSFTDPEKLLEYSELNHCDVFLLDVEMPKLNGLELGRLVSERDEYAVLIYITSHPEFAYNASQIEALGYITKPVDENQFIRLMDRAVMVIKGYQEQILLDNQYLDITAEYEKVRLPVKDIVAIEKHGNFTIITTKQAKEYKYYSSLKKIEKKLNRKRFLKVNNSCYIHLAYVREIKNQSIVMAAGDVIKYYPISRIAYKSVEMEVKRLLAKKRSR